MTTSGGKNGPEDRTNESPSRSGEISRRDLFTARLGALFASGRKPERRLFRRPTTRQDAGIVADQSDCPPVRTINGISIDPVPATTFRDSTNVALVPLFRPPGAIAELAFLAKCTRCNDCKTACPHQAIRPAGNKVPAAEGRPIIEADVQACLMCEDFPCIAACETGALTASVPKVIGTALIKTDLCLAGNADRGGPAVCNDCVEACPIEDAIQTSDRAPSVIEDVCTGCGVCRSVCPAPSNAVVLMPVFHRPNPSSGVSS